MKIEEASPFLQVNALAKRARQLIQGAPPRVPSPLRRPAAVALAEMQAGKIEVYAKDEAAQILEEDTRGPTEDQQAATEEARAALARMFGESDGEDAAPGTGDGAPEASAPETPEGAEAPAEAREPEAGELEAPVEPSADPVSSDDAAADEEASPPEAG